MLDMTWAVLVEVYRDYGMKFDEAITELQSRLADPSTPEGRKAKENAPDDQASMAMLMGLMSGSDFGGPTG